MNAAEATAGLDIKMNGWVVTHVPVTIWDRICNIQRAALLPHHLKDGGSGTIIGTGVGGRDHNCLRGQHSIGQIVTFYIDEPLLTKAILLF